MYMTEEQRNKRYQLARDYDYYIRTGVIAGHLKKADEILKQIKQIDFNAMWD